MLLLLIHLLTFNFGRAKALTNHGVEDAVEDSAASHHERIISGIQEKSAHMAYFQRLLYY